MSGGTKEFHQVAMAETGWRRAEGKESGGRVEYFKNLEAKQIRCPANVFVLIKAARLFFRLGFALLSVQIFN